MVLCFLSVKEEGQVKSLLGKTDRCRNGNGNSFVRGAVKNSLFSANLFKISCCVELAELRYLVSGLNLTCVDELRSFSAALCSEIAKLKHAGTL